MYSFRGRMLQSVQISEKVSNLSGKITRLKMVHFMEQAQFPYMLLR